VKKTGTLDRVGFYAECAKNGDIFVLGGNQGDAVRIPPYPADRLLGYAGLRPRSSRPTWSG
jgi:hypothetical protein